MKFLALQVLALCGLAALSASSVAADEPFISTCDVDCVGPMNACGWAAIAGKGSQAECEAQNAKCIKDCVAKNGVKKFVYKEQPHPEANLTPKPAAKTPSYNFRSVDKPNKY